MENNLSGFQFIDPQHIRREKEKARLLRQSQWWKNYRGRNRCHYCRSATPAKELTMDHIIPLSRGGLTERKNVAPCCKKCNNLKKNMRPEEWEEFLIRSGQEDEFER